MLRILLFLALTASLVLNGVLIGDRLSGSKTRKYTAVRVVDGDTFEVEGGAMVRLLGLEQLVLGVEAPEIGFCGADEARTRKEITVRQSTNDRFLRVVGDVYVDGESVNNAMIESGWAVYDSSDSVDGKKMLVSGQQARDKKIGVFSAACTQLSNEQDLKCVIKGNVNPNRVNRLYYFPGCGKYTALPVELFRGDRWFCSEKEAREAGFSKSGDCLEKSFK